MRPAFAFWASIMLIGHADSVAKDIYLAVRQDGHHGKGTATDPFDAGTPAKYNELLARFNQDTSFHYAPGIYETTGWFYRKRQTVNPNCHHYGAGIDRTVVMLVGAHDPTQDGVIFGHDYDQTADGFEVHDMTLDANALGNPKFVDGTGMVGCAGAVGNNILFSNLKFIHFGTRHRGAECFAFLCYAGPSQVGKHFTNVRLENSIFTDPASGNLDGLTCSGMGAAEGASLDGTIAGCRFIHV
ncbi:MAG: hypothetical protein JOY96_04815, partial [Verrucomicrobia bacterium]|nr:hypothetical protein [Verrucomicrobiota bacterium]